MGAQKNSPLAVDSFHGGAPRYCYCCQGKVPLPKGPWLTSHPNANFQVWLYDKYLPAERTPAVLLAPDVPSLALGSGGVA